MKVLKASAGSGKTYALSHTYIDMLLQSGDPYAYRHILAVTFTNKATAEMKSRILRDLKKEAEEGGPRASRAREVLVNILHDYSAFAVSTIDKFFQQALKAFSREIGQFSSYQIELDRNSLIQESMDRILDGLTLEKKDLLDWLRRSAMDKLEQGQKFVIDDGLGEIGKLLKSESHRQLQEKYGLNDADEFSKARLDEIRKSCRAVIDDFRKKAEAFGIKAEPGEKIQEPNKTAKKNDPELALLFEKPYDYYCTAYCIDKLVFSLGLAGEFYKEFDALLKEKNVMPLDDSNTILRDIIDGSDAPFVYEKLGVRFEHFLLDEFQDTSRIQWDNFLPLLRESEANAPDKESSSLIVGDVKQSIYRWRNSDWELLGHEVEEAFPDVKPEPMECNWRSSQMVVDFNNRFFKRAAEVIGASEIYADVKQEKKSGEEQKGSVQVTFTDDQMAAVIGSVQSARNAGARWSDIAILVRKNADGSAVAEELINHNLPVISDDSLAVKSSAVVRRLVSLLSSIENPDNTVGSYLAHQLGVEFPDRYHSLVDLCENLLRSLRDYDPSSFEGETLFIQAFMDGLREWVDVNGNNLRAFLKHWADANPYIGSPEDSDSIRILTIHKSKGLEFPYVIFPFADTVGFFRETTEWCHLDADDSPLGSVVTGNYPVSLTSGASRKTLFAKDLDREEFLQKVDNINVFYVALTRAGKCLHVISKTPSKKFREAYSKGREEYGRFSEILYAFCGGLENQFYGEPYDFSRMVREKGQEVGDFPASYPSFPLDGRLSPSEDATDYFGEDGVAGPAASARLSGIELHKALEGVRSPEDLPSDLDADSRSLLTARILAHPEWFSSTDVRDEVTIFGTDGQEHRPDRVIFNGQEVFVLDYKFGAERKESYIWQVRSYMKLYRQLGYKPKGAVWYVPDDEVVEVKSIHVCN